MKTNPLSSNTTAYRCSYPMPSVSEFQYVFHGSLLKVTNRLLTPLCSMLTLHVDSWASTLHIWSTLLQPLLPTPSSSTTHELMLASDIYTFPCYSLSLKFYFPVMHQYLIHRSKPHTNPIFFHYIIRTQAQHSKPISLHGNPTATFTVQNHLSRESHHNSSETPISIFSFQTLWFFQTWHLK